MVEAQLNHFGAKTSRSKHQPLTEARLYATQPLIEHLCLNDIHCRRVETRKCPPSPSEIGLEPFSLKETLPDLAGKQTKYVCRLSNIDLWLWWGDSKSGFIRYLHGNDSLMFTRVTIKNS